jgi:uncharacterized protein Yka (UPF0111/DUF47 family)
MAFSLFPRSYKFYEMFEHQNTQILKAISLLDAIFRQEGDLAHHGKEIQLIEAEGNNISREISRQLSLTFITPLDREDIHDLNMAQEALLNVIKGISTRISLMSVVHMTPAARELIANLHFMIEEIHNILLLVIRKKEPAEEVRRVKTLKEHSDLILVQALAAVYQFDTSGPEAICEIITWSQLYDRIEKAVIRAENLANMLEGISIKYA